MHRTAASVLAAFTVFGFATTRVGGPPDRHPGAMTVHEWGTFTTVAGTDGRAIDWLPLAGPTDLPCFVEHYENNPLVKIVAGSPKSVTYEAARASLKAKVRMETPVLYFYAPQETQADVRVRFPRGLMTEWYPHAAVVQAIADSNTLRNPNQAATIRWSNVRVSAGTTGKFPTERGESHYYAARQTDATPLAVGNQSERFLFYRGVADFDVPVSATALDNGAVRITNLGSDDLPAVVLFENRHGAIGYRVHGALHGDVTLDAPALNATPATLHADLARMLVNAGLYDREAKAMVDTWRDSWFEEGARVFYVLPARAVDAILPLEISPAPAAVARVFVGRMEVVTPVIQRSVEQAIDRNDAGVLETYGRFLGPITDRVLAKAEDPPRAARIREITNRAFASYLKRATICE